MAHADDESQWDADPLVRALRAPGTPAELTGEKDFVAAYRAQQPRGNVRRLVGRFGIGATTAVTTIALSAGVAAAYGRVLPDPVQRIAHSVLGPVGVPAPTAPQSSVPVVAPTRSATATPGKAPRPTASATRGTSPRPQATQSEAATPTTAPPSDVPTPTGTPTPTPTATPTAPVHRIPAALNGSVSDRRVVVGGTVTMTGVMTDPDGVPLRGRTVRLLGRSSGTWTELAKGRTDKTGTVSLVSVPLTQNTGLRLSTSHHVHSPLVGVQVIPLVVASASESEGTSTVTVTVTGGQTGDEVTAYRRRGDAFVKVGAAKIGDGGTATFTVPTPKHAARFVVRLSASKHHGKAQTSVVLGRTATP